LIYRKRKKISFSSVLFLKEQIDKIRRRKIELNTKNLLKIQAKKHPKKKKKKFKKLKIKTQGS